MSAKAIREATGKDILNRLLDSSSGAAKSQFATVNSETNWDQLRLSHPWLETTVCIIFFFGLLLFSGHMCHSLKKKNEKFRVKLVREQ